MEVVESLTKIDSLILFRFLQCKEFCYVTIQLKDSSHPVELSSLEQTFLLGRIQGAKITKDCLKHLQANENVISVEISMTGTDFD